MPRALSATRRCLEFLVALLLASAPARGGEAVPTGNATAEPRPQAEPVDVLVTGSRASVRAPAAEATVVQADEFAGEVRSVAELLSTAPGVSLHSLGGPGQATTLSLRGATADESLVLLDGIPLHGPGGGAVDLETLPAALLDRIVISRGVLGAQFGAGALGGVVELVPRKPKARSGGAQLSVGSYWTGQLSGDVEFGDASGSGLAGIQLDTTEGNFSYAQPRTPEIAGSETDLATRQNAYARRGSLLLRWAQQIAADSEVDFVLQGTAGWRGLPGPSSFPTLQSRALDQGGVLGARIRGEADGIAWSGRVWGRVDRLELRGVQIFGDCTDGDPSCPRSVERSTATQAEVEIGVPIGSAHLLRVTGAGGEESIAGSPTGSHRRGSGSLAAIGDLRFGRAAVHPAVRTEIVGSQAAVSPGIAASWSPFAEGTLAPLELRTGAGLSFRPPTLSELYLDQGGILPNPDLQSEHAWSVDAGVRWRARAFTVSVGAFWSRYRDLISYELFPPVRVKPFNVAAARIAGVEVQVVARLPYALTALASYSYLDAVNLRSGIEGGHHLSYRPPHRLFARLAHRADRIEGYFEANATSSMPRNNFDTAYLPAQLTLNAGVGARVTEALWLDVEAKNLLDDRTQQDLFQYPLPGFTLAAVARARF